MRNNGGRLAIFQGGNILYCLKYLDVIKYYSVVSLRDKKPLQAQQRYKKKQTH